MFLKSNVYLRHRGKYFPKTSYVEIEAFIVKGANRMKLISHLHGTKTVSCADRMTGQTDTSAISYFFSTSKSEKTSNVTIFINL